MEGRPGKRRARVLTLSPHGPPRLEGFETINVPALELVQALNEKDLRRALEGAEAVVFTSRTGVRLFFSLKDAEELLKGKKVVAIGPKTAEELRKHGIEADVPEEFHSASLAKLLHGYSKVVALRSDKASKTLREALGNKLVEVVIYKTVRKPSKEIVEKARNVDFIAVSSAEIARALIESFEKFSDLEELKSKKIVVIGPEAARPLREKGIPFELAPEATWEGIRRKLEELSE